MYSLIYNCAQLIRLIDGVAMPHLYEEVNKLLEDIIEGQPKTEITSYDVLTTDASTIDASGINVHISGGIILSYLESLLREVQATIKDNRYDTSLLGIRALVSDISSKVKSATIVTADLVDNIIKETYTLEEPSEDTLVYLTRLKGVCCPCDQEEVKALLKQTLADDIKERMERSNSFAWSNPIPGDKKAILTLESFIDGKATAAELQAAAATLSGLKALDTLAKSGKLDSLVALPVKTAKDFVSALGTREARGLAAFTTSSDVKPLV